jgi:carbon-monoxide dehydrogenase medium subunit
MKPVAFAYARPTQLDEAIRLIGEQHNAKILAGGQTLGPLLNLRLVQPDLVIDITRISELTRVEETREAITYGACITHAAFEDRRLADAANGFLSAVASGIGYRAVRSRGTVGGSLAYADPAADWITAFAALDAQVFVSGPAGRRRVAANVFMRGALAPDLAGGELVDGVEVPRLSGQARWGFAKICRKVGEFAEAIGAVVHDPARGYLRLVAGATGGRPIVLAAADVAHEPSEGLPAAKLFDMARAKESLRRAGLGDDAYELNIHAVALRRALEQAAA